MPVNYTNGLIRWYAPLNDVVYEVLSGQGDMRDAAFGTGVIIADAVALAELPGGTGHELVNLLHAMTGAAPAPLSVNVGLLAGGTGVNAIAARASAIVEWRATDQAVALGCCVGEDMHAPTERIRADSIAAGAAQLRAVLAEILA
jgi:acetylornithine deacetylase/succinyl-diaminopimelate desuccinylase-like protein